MDMTTQELLDAIDSNIKVPNIGSLSIEKIERLEVDAGWYLDHAVNGITTRLGAYTRSTRVVSIFNGGQWGEIGGTFAEIDAESLILSFHHQYHIS